MFLHASLSNWLGDIMWSHQNNISGSIASVIIKTLSNTLGLLYNTSFLGDGFSDVHATQIHIVIHSELDSGKLCSNFHQECYSQILKKFPVILKKCTQYLAHNSQLITTVGKHIIKLIHFLVLVYHGRGFDIIF